MFADHITGGDGSAHFREDNQITKGPGPLSAYTQLVAPEEAKA